MAANTNPIFTLTPVIKIGQVSTANANLDGTGTVATIITGGTNGTRIHKIEVKAIVTTTDGMIRLFIYDGTNTRLWKEISVSAITKSGTVGSFETSIDLLGEEALVLPVNYELRASTENAETFNIIAEGGDF